MPPEPIRQLIDYLIRYQRVKQYITLIYEDTFANVDTTFTGSV